MGFPFNHEGILHFVLPLKIGIMSDNDDVRGVFLHIGSGQVRAGAGVVRR